MPTAIGSSESAASSIVKDPFLQSVLATSTLTRDQCLTLVDLISSRPISSSEPRPPFTEDQLDLTKQQKLLYSYLSQLRGQNRDALWKVRETKQETAEARQEVDRLHLQLGNLYYEEKHLRGEVAACESYDHAYQKLPMIPVEEFLENHPEHEGDDDEKTLMFARINHELAEREALEEQRQGLLKKKQGLIADNKKRKEDLASLDKDLENFIDAAKPIIKTFEKHT